MWEQIVFSIAFILIILAIVSLFFFLLHIRDQERKQLRATAYREGIGYEYELELKRLLEVQSLQPQDAPRGPDPYSDALHTVRLRKRIMANNPPRPDKTILSISNSTLAGVNFGTLLGDLNASVQILQTHGDQQIAEAIGKLSDAISKWAAIDDTHRKELLENVAQVSKEASSPPDQRRPGVIKASLAFLTTSLSTVKELVPLVHDLYEKLKAAGIIQ